MSPPCSRRIFWLTGRPRPVPRRAFARLEDREDLFDVLRGDPFAVVGHDDADGCGPSGRTRWSDVDPAPSVLLAGVDGVGDDVQNRPVQQLGVEHEHAGMSARGCQASSHAGFGGAGLHQLDDVGDRLVEVGRRCSSGSRSLLNVSMSITRLEIRSWFFSTILQPRRTTSLSLALAALPRSGSCRRECLAECS